MPGGFGGGGGFPFLPTQMTLLIHLTNFPEWAIPMTRLVPIFYVDDSWDKSHITLTTRFRYWWKKIDDVTYDIYIEIYGNAAYPSHSYPNLIPFYLDLDLVIVNENIYEEVDTDKT